MIKKDDKINIIKLDLIKTLLMSGTPYANIADILQETEPCIDHVIRKYNLHKDMEVLHKKKQKLTNEDMGTICKEMGETLLRNYTPLKLDIPKSYKNRASREEVSTLFISDMHTGGINEWYDKDSGKKVITFNKEILDREIKNLTASVGQIHTLLSSSYRLRKLVLILGGDILTNDRIFKEQKFEIEKPVGLQIWDCLEHLLYIITYCLRYYETIQIECRVGNHGRSLPDSYEEPVENNFEFFIYKFLEKQFEKEKRVTVNAPATRRAIHTIFDWRFLSEHGDQLKGFSEQAIISQAKELYITMGGFEMWLFGHLHRLKEIPVSDKITVKQNGSFEEKSTYAFNKYRTYSLPQQWFFGTNEKRIETWCYKLDVRG